MSATRPETLWSLRHRSAEEYRLASAFDDQARRDNNLPPRDGPLFPTTGRRRRSGRQANRPDFEVYDDDDTTPGARDFHFHVSETGESSTRSLPVGRTSKRRRVRLQDLEDDFSGLDFAPAVEDTSDPRSAPLQEHGRPHEFLDGAGELQDDVVDNGEELQTKMGAGKRYLSSVSFFILDRYTCRLSGSRTTQ